MSQEILTQKQKTFLEECNLEFSERFTDYDIEFKKVFDSELPPPPIISPWHYRQRFNNRGRDRPSASYNNYGNRNNRDFNENDYGEYQNRRYRPY